MSSQRIKFTKHINLISTESYKTRQLGKKALTNALHWQSLKFEDFDFLISPFMALKQSIQSQLILLLKIKQWILNQTSNKMVRI